MTEPVILFWYGEKSYDIGKTPLDEAWIRLRELSRIHSLCARQRFNRILKQLLVCVSTWRIASCYRLEVRPVLTKIEGLSQKCVIMFAPTRGEDGSGRRSSGLGNRNRDLTQAYWNSLRPTGAKVFEKCELWLE